VGATTLSGKGYTLSDRFCLKLVQHTKKSLPIARCRCPCLGFIPAVNLLMQWESRRQSCLKIDLFSGDGVVEFQILGVQEISSIAGEAGEILKRLAG
jgi:hypothetical protein